MAPSTLYQHLTPEAKLWEYLDQGRAMGFCGGVQQVVEKIVEQVKVFFKVGEPVTFKEYDGQGPIVSYLEDAVRALGPTELAIEPQVFLGMAGMGKTLLAKIVAHELQLRAERLGLPTPVFLEVFPADLVDIPALDAIMRRVQDNPGTVMFIDEIHDLTGPLSRKLYLVLEEGRYLFSGESAPTQLPPTTLLAATTDWGSVHAALKRRWISHQLKPASEAQLLQYVQRRVPIAPSAAQLIVSRTKWSGAPWEGIQLGKMSWTTAKARGAQAVEDVDVEHVFAAQEIDQYGLRWQDRKVLQVLLGQPKYRRVKGQNEFVAYAAAEAAVVALAGLDRAEYRDAVKPRLMSRGLLEVRNTYGQALTAKAVELYADLEREVA